MCKSRALIRISSASYATKIWLNKESKKRAKEARIFA